MNASTLSPKPSVDGRRVKYSQLRDLLFPSFRQYTLRVIGGLAALVLVDLLQLIIPRFIKHGVDALSAKSIHEPGLLQLAAIIVGIAVVIVGLRFVWRYLIIGFSRLLERAVRNRLFSHLLTMDAPFFEKHTPGDLMAHSSNDLSAVQMACGMGLVAGVDAFMMSFAAICFMAAIHPLLTFFALLPMPFLAVATRILSAHLHRQFATVQQEFSKITEFSRSNLISVGLIKAYTMENFQTRRFDELGKRYVRSNLRAAAIQGLITPLATLVGSMGMLIVLYFGGSLVIKSVITIGDFVAFISYLYMLIWPMMAIGWVANLVQRGLTSLDRIHTITASRALLPNPHLEKPKLPLDHPGFRLSALTFTYPSSRSPALENLTLDLEPGIHGITGRTGSGKSTLCRILTRLYPVADGMLLFGNEEVNLLPLDYMRAHIAYVSQEPILFSDSIAANIGLGRSDASREEIIDAAKNAAIHEDIVALSEGYDTVIGERGVKLSGGQRQRLALARALVSNRPVLVIDDGLSAVDVATEHAVFAGLKKHFQGKTVIIVSNRIKLLSMTDHIVVLAEGKVENQGSHEELLAVNTLYQAMFAKQMQQENEDEVSPQ